MNIVSQQAPDIIELKDNEKLLVSSTYEVIKRSYTASNFKRVKLKVYDNFFVVETTDTKNKTSRQAFSDT